MIVVGHITTPEEAEEIEFIAKIFMIANRIRMISRGD